MEWETVIGLEVHVQLKTMSKIFSGAATSYGAAPNTQACAIDLGLPGVLPVLNEEVVKLAVKFGIAIGATIAPFSTFARKNYFYPDLPKGYQISQYETPIVSNGKLNISVNSHASQPAAMSASAQQTTTKDITIIRAHLEEDAGKSLHEYFPNATGVDLNRAGIPLLEIVSAPDLSSAAEAVTYLKAIHSLVKYLEISDGNMQEGSFRCDANVSVKPKGNTTLGTRVEVKNINSFKFVEQAINYEVSRQIDLLESGKQVVQETRMFLPKKQETRPMRSKEEAMDYRYFPDPDLLPVAVDAAFIAKVSTTLPELAAAKQQRFQDEYGISSIDALTLTHSKELADYFEATAIAAGHVSTAGHSARLAANWILVELLAALNKEELTIENSPISAQQLGNLLTKIIDNTISGKIAKTVFETMWSGESKNADVIIEKHGLRQITDVSAIEKIADEIIALNPTQVAEYKSGKEKLFGFFVGQVLKASKGKANPEQVNAIIRRKLTE